MNSPSTRAGRALAALVLAFTTGACGSDALTNPTPVTPTSVTETFTGSLSRNGAATYSFAVTTIGQTTNVTAQLSNVAPDNTIAIGIALGTWNGASCQIVISNDKALMGATVFGTVNTSGTLCIRVFDVGNVNDPVTYEVKVVHF